MGARIRPARAALAVAAAVFTSTSTAQAGPAARETGAVSFSEVSPGVEVAELAWPVASTHGDSRLTVLRIDATRRALVLEMAGEHGVPFAEAPAWAAAADLDVVVNAGMFETEEGPTAGRATHFMRGPRHTSNATVRGDNAFLVFSPRREGLAPVDILDRRCEGGPAQVARAMKDYRVVIQGIRMVDCHRQNRWSAQPKRWSMVVAAVDGAGRLLFLFSRSPYRVHDFIDMALALPLDVQRMMYLEGGPEASLWWRPSDGRAEARLGSYETGFFESDDNDIFWPIPNVIGVSAIAADAPTAPSGPGAGAPRRIGSDRVRPRSCCRRERRGAGGRRGASRGRAPPPPRGPAAPSPDRRRPSP